MTIALLIGAGILLLYLGGEGLVRGASDIALRLGLTPLVIGLTVVAFGTSLPELVVSLDASLSGSSDVAMGNVVGSNIANVALILGLAALVRPISTDLRILRVDGPLVVGVSLLLLAFLIDGSISRIEGTVLIAGLIGYVVTTLRLADPQAPDPDVEPRGSAWRDGAFVLGGLAALVIGGGLFVDGAVQMAQTLGISEAVIGLTIVAVGTSLPELVTSLLASIRNKGDLAIGNVLGSNLFNILGILGITSLVTPLGRGGITWFDLGFMTVLGIVLLPMLLSHRRLGRAEGAVLVLSYAVYVYLVL